MQPASQQLADDIAVEDIEFVLGECARFHELFRQTTPLEFTKRLPSADSSAYLTLSNGRQFICGAQALRRLYDLATRALARSDVSGQIELESVYNELKISVPRVFLEQQLPIELVQIEQVLAEAIDKAKSARSDRVHFIPCRLMRVQEPKTIRIGPVTFHAHDAIAERVEPLYGDYLRRGIAERRGEICEMLIADAKHYYGGFGWIAEVEIFQCDPGISLERADLAVHAALNVLHALLGAECSGRMAIGGPRLPDDRRAHLHQDEQGQLEITCSSNVTSEVGFGDSFGRFFARADVTFLIGAASKAIQAIVHPRIQRPVGLRLLDAFSWFGDAARESSDAARIVKATNALERLLATRERAAAASVTKTFSRRGAAISYEGPLGESFDALCRQFRAAYEIRSALAHGSMSPFAPEVKENTASFMLLVRRALCCALGLFEQRGFLDRPGADAALPPWLDQLADHTETVDATQRGVAP